MNLKRKMLSILPAFTIVLAILLLTPITAKAAGTIDLSKIYQNVEVQDGYTLTGCIGGNYKISIADGATVTLEDVTIEGVDDDSNHCNWAGITCNGNATIILKGENYVKGIGDRYPGIHVPKAKGKSLVINGDGLLTAVANRCGAGIGSSGYYSDEDGLGNIIIEGGTVNAIGGIDGAGIGAGTYNQSFGNITISGGYVYAVGGSSATGIGTSSATGNELFSSCGDITISGGYVYAVGERRAAGIGTGSATYNGICSCGDITISGGYVYAYGGDDAAAIGTGYAEGNKKNTCGKITIGSGANLIRATRGSEKADFIGGGYNSQPGKVVFELYNDAAKYTDKTEENTYTYVKKDSLGAYAENVSAKYDGEPHSITVSVLNPASGVKIKYGTVLGTYNLDKAPTITNAGTKNVYYEVTADGYEPLQGFATIQIDKVLNKNPPAVVLKSHTSTTVELEPIENGEYCYAEIDEEGYSRNYSAWRDIPIFTGLTKGKRYRFRQRIKEDENHLASSSSDISITIGKHEHGWIYEANEAEIIGTCKNRDLLHEGELTEIITILKPEHVVDGDGKSEKATVKVDGVKSDSINIQYKKGSDILDKAPTEPGTYTASILLGGATASVEYTIYPKYSITVSNDGNGTASANPTSGIAGTEVTLTATPNEGYQFKEWDVVSGDVTVSDDNTFVIGDKDVEIKAIFEKEYSVTVFGDGNGTASANPTSGVAGTEVTLTATPNEGYQFRNWLVLSGDVTVNDNNFTIGTADVQVVAIFEKEYSVTVSGNENGTASANPTSGVAGTEVILTATPNEGYRFMKWVVISGGVTVKDNKFTIGTADVTVVALFEKNSSASYTITFDAGEGTGIMPSVDKGAGSYTLPANGFTAPAGKEFKAWLVDGEEKNPDTVIEVNGNITITAIWTDHVHNYGAATYTWTGDNSKVTAKKICEDDAHVETETVNTTSVETAATCEEKGKITYKATFTKDGFTEQTKTVENVEAVGHDWGEWEVTTQATETAEGVETRTCKNESSHTETHAIAKLGVTSYAITVNSGLGGSASASAGTAEIGVAVSITATPYAGYELDRITYIPEGESATDITLEPSFIMPEVNVTVNVTFKEKAVTTPDPATYKVTFVTNEGTEVAEQIVQADDKAAKPADPQKEGYTFEGWYTDEDLTEEYDFNTPVTADVIVYAKWIEKTYTVAVSGDGNGTASSNPTSGVAGTVVTLTATPNEGYRFKEWDVVAGDVTVSDDNTFVIGEKDVEVKAIFEKIPKATDPDDSNNGVNNSQTPPNGVNNSQTPPNGGNNGQPSANGGNNGQPAAGGGATPQTPSGGGTDNQTPLTSATEVKVGDTIKDDKTNTSYIITSTKTNKETVTYVSTTNNTVTSLTVPNTVTVGGKKYKVTEIKANAFKNNKKLKKITIGKNIEKIGKNAFSGCKNLKTVNIKTTKLTKKTVGANAFKGINAKAKVTVPKSKLKAYKTILKARGIKGKKQKIK